MSANEHDDDQPDSFYVIELLRAENERLQRSVYVAERGWSLEQNRIDAAVEAMRAKCEAIARPYAPHSSTAAVIADAIASLKGNGESA